jgi:hypothetical protein
LQVALRPPQLSQVAGDETCDLVDERPNRIVREDLRVVQKNGQKNGLMPDNDRLTDFLDPAE